MTLTHMSTTRAADARADPPQHEGLNEVRSRRSLREMTGRMLAPQPRLSRGRWLLRSTHRGARDLLAPGAPSG